MTEIKGWSVLHPPPSGLFDPHTPSTPPRTHGTPVNNSNVAARSADHPRMLPDPTAPRIAAASSQNSSSAMSANEHHALRRKTPYGVLSGAYESALYHPTPTKRAIHPAGFSYPAQLHHPVIPNHDSMTFSFTRYPLQFVNPLAQNAATVIQLPTHPCGPTASGPGSDDQGGPFWNHGLAGPYMPSATRDPRDHTVESPTAAYTFHSDTAVRTSPVQAHRRSVPRAPVSLPWIRTPPQSPWMAHEASAPFQIRSLSQSPTRLETTPVGGHDKSSAFGVGLAAYRDLLAAIASSRSPSRGWGPGASPQRPQIFPRPPPSWAQGSTISLGLQSCTRYDLMSGKTPWERASTSLRTLEHHCLCSDWQWIDGMNLCGCLAYGLTDYRKASEMYKRVLALDASHIEAKANLAATSLCLGQITDAERLWFEVIEQAPDYFDAVDHLVGLLCSSARPLDAISVISLVQDRLRLAGDGASYGIALKSAPKPNVTSSTKGRGPGADAYRLRRDSAMSVPGYGSSGYAIAGSENGRLLALGHTKANLMYSAGDYSGAVAAFEDVVTIATGSRFSHITEVVEKVLHVAQSQFIAPESCPSREQGAVTVLLHPELAVQVSQLCFPETGGLPGFAWLPKLHTEARNGALLTTSNALLSLAKILQDGMSCASQKQKVLRPAYGVREILALYYLSLSLHPSPSTANNVGIMLASVQHAASPVVVSQARNAPGRKIPGVLPGSGIDLALAYYHYGLALDPKHAHLYTNLGSLLKDIGQLDAAIEMYKLAVQCDHKFDIALANLANALKDRGRINDAILHYNRAVNVNPGFAEAVCGLANALNSVCSWAGRGGIVSDGGRRDPWHVDSQGMLFNVTGSDVLNSGWMKRVIDIVEKQLREGEDWGVGCITEDAIGKLTTTASHPCLDLIPPANIARFKRLLRSWCGEQGEGARIVRFIERMTRHIGWVRYKDKFLSRQERDVASYKRPTVPPNLALPAIPTVLPFHTFTSPLSAKQIRLISQRNADRISASALKASWLPAEVYPPPQPPRPALKVGYVSSDFNNHPLAHLMQSAFGFHDTKRVEAYCYATTASDGSVHRTQIESECPHFVDVSTFSNEQLVSRIVADGIHILVNLNGYTRGARNEVFAARPAPIQMSFMGFAGTMGAEWCDYLLADRTSIPPSTLRPGSREVDFADYERKLQCPNEEDDAWVYAESIIYCRSSFFCCDHRQSAPDASEPSLTWAAEQDARWKMRSELFPMLKADGIIFANFNQLYKIEPTTFRSWLRILAKVPNAILWLLRFPDVGEANLMQTARKWAGEEVAGRVIFTDVAPKNLHIARAKIVDLFLDTPECNAHTTAADVLWSGTPLLTYPRYEYKMCSRMAASILRGALPHDPDVRTNAEKDLIASSQEEYEELAISLGNGLKYPSMDAEGTLGRGEGRLLELRRMLTEARWSSDLFDTRRWVSDLEDGYEEAWRKWVQGRSGDIYLEQLPRGRTGPLP